VRKERKKRNGNEDQKVEREKNVFCNATKQTRCSQCRQKEINIEINTFEIKGNLKMEGNKFEQRWLNIIKRGTIAELITLGNKILAHERFIVFLT
jgi:hypothetical protein